MRKVASLQIFVSLTSAKSVPSFAYRFSCFFQFDSPSVQRIVKHCSDNLQTLLHILMLCPSCTRPHIRIRSPPAKVQPLRAKWKKKVGETGKTAGESFHVAYGEVSQLSDSMFSTSELKKIADGVSSVCDFMLI